MKTIGALTTAAVFALGGAPGLAQVAQEPRPDAPAPVAQPVQASGTTTLVGCLYREQDVRGRQPNVAERAGVLEDYILATGSATEGAAGTRAAARMFKVEHVDDERLGALVGKRVEVTGRIDAEAGDVQPAPAGTSGTAEPAPDRSAGPDRIELPEFEATSIREVPGACPAVPSTGAEPPALTVDQRQQPTAQEPATATSATTTAATSGRTQPPVTTVPSYPPRDPASGPTPRASARAGAPPAGTMTLSGCLYREEDVPGRKPNIAERAGVLEDYILADARVVAPESSGSDSVGTAGVTQPPVPAAGAMYKVEHIADERLRPLVGKRVEVIGRIDVEADEMKTAGTAGASTPPQPDRSIGPDRIELPEFEASSIREIAGVCPATPPGR